MLRSTRHSLALKRVAANVSKQWAAPSTKPCLPTTPSRQARLYSSCQQYEGIELRHRLFTGTSMHSSLPSVYRRGDSLLVGRFVRRFSTEPRSEHHSSKPGEHGETHGTTHSHHKRVPFSEAHPNSPSQHHHWGEVSGVKKLARKLEEFAASTKDVTDPDFRYPPIQKPPPEVESTIPYLQRALNLHGYQMARVVVGVLVGGGILAYIFQDDIQRMLGRSGAEVASEIISDKKVHQNAEELSRAVLYQLLTDEKTIQHARVFLRDLFAEPELVQALTTLLNGVLSSPGFRAQALIFFQYLFSTPDLRRATGDLFYQVLQYDSTRDAAISLFKQVLNDPAMRATISDLFADVLTYDVVVNASADLGSKTAHNVLNDAAVEQHSVEYVERVLNQDKVQQDAGDAIYNAVLYSMIPTWLRRKKDSPAAGLPDPPPPAPMPGPPAPAGTDGVTPDMAEGGKEGEAEKVETAAEDVPADYDPLEDNRVPQ